jgi:hypothetical protein
MNCMCNLKFLIYFVVCVQEANSTKTFWLLFVASFEKGNHFCIFQFIWNFSSDMFFI